MINQRTYLLLLLVSGALFLVAAVIGSAIPDEIAHIGKQPVHFEDSTTTARLSLINSAVHAVPRNRFFEYTGGFENPFRQLSDQRLKATTRSGKPSRTKLLLKGILIKDRPLAILEDNNGETYIRGVGDKALEQLVVAIAENRVTLRDHLGTYELTVEEH